jgi:antitoxin MazE
MITRITKWGNGRGIRLSKTLLSNVDMSDYDQVNVIAEQGRIIIEKATIKHLSLQDRMRGYKGKYDVELADWDSPIGKEVW